MGTDSQASASEAGGSRSSAPQPSPDRNHSPHNSSLAVWLASGLGVGFLGPAPGTLGALWGLPLAVAIAWLPGWLWQGLALAAVNLAGVPLCTRAGRDLGGQKDNQAIVWDELATVPLAFLLVPLVNWRVALAGFLLIRVLDIAKPPPARQLERLSEGLGVMADDWVAGVYAALALAALAWLDRATGMGWLG